MKIFIKKINWKLILFFLFGGGSFMIFYLTGDPFIFRIFILSFAIYIVIAFWSEQSKHN